MLTRFKKLTPKQIYRNHLIRIAIFSALSVSLAYMIGSLIPVVDPIIAAITALIAIRPTFHASVRESWGQILGTFVGAAASLIIVSFTGFNIFTLAVMIVISFFIAWILKIGEEGAISIGVTVILVAGPLFGDYDSIEGRLFGVALGALCGLTASFFVTPGQPHRRALDASMVQVRRSSVLLHKIALRLAEGSLDGKESEEWLAEVEDIVEKSEKARKEAEDAVKGAKWSPLLRKNETIDVLDEVLKNQEVVFTVKSICEDAIQSATSGKKFKGKVALTLSNMLLNTVANINEHINETDNIIYYDEVVTSEISTLKNLDDTQAIILGGSIARDATKIKQALSD